MLVYYAHLNDFWTLRFVVNVALLVVHHLHYSSVLGFEAICQILWNYNNEQLEGDKRKEKKIENVLSGLLLLLLLLNTFKPLNNDFLRFTYD